MTALWYRHLSERWFHARLTITEGSIVSRCLGRSSDREPVLLTATPGSDACQACQRELEHAERPAVAGFLGVSEIELEAFDEEDVTKPVHERFDHGDIECGGEA